MNKSSTKKKALTTNQNVAQVVEKHVKTKNHKEITNSKNKNYKKGIAAAIFFLFL